MDEIIIRNPISVSVKESIVKTKARIAIAVPFISSFARSILDSDLILKIKDKRLITRFDETSISSFDLPTLKYLLASGFRIRYDNNIHLKLYLFDDEAYVTSSNLTKAGFEDNVELTVKVDSKNVAECQVIFNELWSLSASNNVTDKLIEMNWPKYEILKRRDNLRQKTTIINIDYVPKNVGSLDLQLLFSEILEQKTDFSNRLLISTKANVRREQVKERLRKGFDSKIFYVEKGHKARKENLFYDFVYGYEGKLAGTGLWEEHFKAAFEHKDFKELISFIYPEMHGSAKWNFEDKSAFAVFCNGIYDFNIPSFTKVLPIRLASYFYPQYFISIFVLDVLEEICNSLGLETAAKTQGERLFAYNTFIKDRMKVSPYPNHVKSHLAYQFFYAKELYTRLKNKEGFEMIKASYDVEWKRNLVDDGKKFLMNLEVI